MFNAYFSARQAAAFNGDVIPLLGIFVALSALVMLYKSYHARGYLLFLGNEAKQGRLTEEYLPSLAGRTRGSITGDEESGSVRGSNEPLMHYSPGCSCRFFL